MTVTFDLPPDIESMLRTNGQDPSAALKEAAMVELYRCGVLSEYQLARALGLERLQVDEVLKRHNVPLEMTIEEIEAEAETLRAGRGG
ncbi:MAG TPA: UPF0175 family protein [Phycisphaerales bacterium]|nr:UPF0175 family protein [Phycisphaerales bacterium]